MSMTTVSILAEFGDITDHDAKIIGKDSSMTEEEAKEKWCPHVRLVIAEDRDGKAYPDGNPSHNRFQIGDYPAQPKGSKCVGSACMAWRWLQKDVFKTEEMVAAGLRNAYIKKTPLPDTGYCGLAGKP